MDRAAARQTTSAPIVAELFTLWQDGGIQAVRETMAVVPEGFTPGIAEEAVTGAAESRSTRPVISTGAPPGPSTAGGMGRRRVLVHHAVEEVA